MARITLRQLEYFVVTSETGSMTAAANRIYISQSAVSTALAELEETLGVQLFVRHARGLTLTANGQKMLLEARQLLASVEDLQNNAKDLSESFSGSLTIGCYSTLSLLVLPRIIDEFLTVHPEVDFNFVIGSHKEMLGKLRDGSCDVALLYDYDFATDLFPDDMTKIVLRSIPPHAVLPESHEFSERESISLADLTSQPLILFDLPPSGEYFKSLFEMRGMTPTIRFRTSEFELVRALVARGLGYSILNQSTDIHLSYENRRLVSRPIADASRGLNVVVAHLSGARLTRRATAFIAHCQQTVALPGFSAIE